MVVVVVVRDGFLSLVCVSIPGHLTHTRDNLWNVFLLFYCSFFLANITYPGVPANPRHIVGYIHFLYTPLIFQHNVNFYNLDGFPVTLPPKGGYTMGWCSLTWQFLLIADWSGILCQTQPLFRDLRSLCQKASTLPDFYQWIAFSQKVVRKSQRFNCKSNQPVNHDGHNQ